MTCFFLSLWSIWREEATAWTNKRVHAIASITHVTIEYWQFVNLILMLLMMIMMIACNLHLIPLYWVAMGKFCRFHFHFTMATDTLVSTYMWILPIDDCGNAKMILLLRLCVEKNVISIICANRWDFQVCREKRIGLARLGSVRFLFYFIKNHFLTHTHEGFCECGW